MVSLTALSILPIISYLSGSVKADTDSDLVGTWSSKSNSVFTGPDFFDPIDELLIEPALPGISYSFTEDGYFEEAIYQVTPNPKDHSCPAAAIIFQHGTYTVNSTGSILLTPFEVDGRQLLSEPCNDNGVSSYTRYSQKETFKQYSVYVDPYHGRWRLDLNQWDGTPVQPLYLAYRPPQMLPTITLNPTSGGDGAATGDGSGSGSNVASSTAAASSSTGLSQRVKRGLENRYRTNAVKKSHFNYDFWWYTSVGFMVAGACLVYRG
ncbi:unnamed protein product [[Candida] boidinii]|nr:hypothetical protein BVG19_g1771 [[Candida] boidinii]OWB48786.1 hypothetical protein B5S27_g321 [[Candida] boidinii]OWB65121.1 hypothetical protein B5S30_g444 [[Candida] boidinii]OWB82517.1 hypothetical protein B5S33_g1143 [[Candida] boidinii]GME88530.1 unnamed protein product [[Candida] boidinii]